MATATPTTVALLASARAESSGRVLSTCSGCVLCMGESPSSLVASTSSVYDVAGRSDAPLKRERAKQYVPPAQAGDGPTRYVVSPATRTV